MAFWGIEVKAGKPVTHKYDLVRGRLHVSQAALGLGSATNKSVVQCNIGNKSPVILCVLLPDRTESCHLDLEFQEADDVIFSVIGPRSVHLTGYYLGRQRSIHNDSSESYGVDIANSDAEQSVHGSEDDSYEDSFIDDADPEVFSSSPITSDYASDEEMLDKKPKTRKSSYRRLKKRYKTIESENESDSQLHDHKGVTVIVSDDEDSAPISTFLKSKTQAEEKVEKDMNKTSDKKIEDGVDHVNKTNNKSSATENLDVSHKKSEKNRKERTSENPQTDGDIYNDVMNDEKIMQLKAEEEKLEKSISKTGDKKIEDSVDHDKETNEKSSATEDLDVSHNKSKKKRKERTSENPETHGDKNVMNDEKIMQLKGEDENRATDRKGVKTCDATKPWTKDDPENDVRPKKRRKKSNENGETLEEKIDNSLEEDIAKQNEEDIFMESKEDQKLPHDKSDIASISVVDENELNNKKCKTKKKSKTKGEKENEDRVSLLSNGGRNKTKIEPNDKKVKSKSTEARTLSHGLIIEDLVMGKPDGKIATSGKKIKVHYVGKSRDDGHTFDSNTGKSPLKLRLGAEDVTEGWNIGLDGMRVGGKRRLTIPPKFRDGSEGAGDKNLPDSWVVYEFDLVSVR